jgi:restriction endonuclease S subunit
MIHYWQPSNSIRDSIYIPKYYNPELAERQAALSGTHTCRTIGELMGAGLLHAKTGHEIGKAAYGTGDIPFVRTSDISNWEIKSAPKQGVSREIYEEYANDQDVQAGDIIFVRDGTYLIGTNCFITDIDKEILYQSHVLKLRVNDKDALNPHLLFLTLNNPWVQRQIRSVQFTADIIDTIGHRFFELVLPIPKNKDVQNRLAEECTNALDTRMVGKAFIKHCPKMMEEALRTGSAEPIENFFGLDIKSKVSIVSNETVTAEFGAFTSFWRDSSTISNQIYLPTYYDISIPAELKELAKYCDLMTIKELMESKAIEFHTGDEIGKMAYDTGTIPFLRTSDFANWEINHNPKQGISEEIYQQYAEGQNVKENDILLVRDGTYLVGSSCIITAEDVKSLFCGGLFKFRVIGGNLDPFLFLGLMNSYIVKRQIRTKQFTRDVIDTLGNRIEEVVLPIPKAAVLRKAISEAVRYVIQSRVNARGVIARLAIEIAPESAVSKL